MAIEWDDIRVFQTAVRAGDYTNAARKLGIDRTTVGRRFARLERAAGRGLWEQAADGYRPTERGKAVLRAAAAMERAMARLGEELLLPGGDLAGPVRLAGTAGIAGLVLPAIAPFLAAHPEVMIELVGAREAIEAVQQRHADLGIAIARGKPRTLAGLRLIPFEQALYTASANAGAARRIGWGHAVMLANPQPWARLNARAAGEGEGACEVDGFGALHDAVRAGLGRAWLWRAVADADPRLARCDAAMPAAAAADLWLVHRADIAIEPAVARLRDALAAALPSYPAAPPALIPQASAAAR